MNLYYSQQFTMKKFLILALFTIVSTTLLVWCGSSTPDTWNTANANYEEIILWHDGRSTMPETTTLPAGKDYKFIITPEKNGVWCMSTIKREWTTTADAQLVVADKTVEFVMNDATPGTYNFVCNGMGMKQWSIVISG